MSLTSLFFVISFHVYRIKKVGGSGKLRSVQTRDAASHGPPRGCVCNCLGPVSGKVSVHEKQYELISYKEN